MKTSSVSVIKHFTGYVINIDGCYYAAKDVFGAWLICKQHGVVCPTID